MVALHTITQVRAIRFNDIDKLEDNGLYLCFADDIDNSVVLNVISEYKERLKAYVQTAGVKLAGNSSVSKYKGQGLNFEQMDVCMRHRVIPVRADKYGRLVFWGTEIRSTIPNVSSINDLLVYLNLFEALAADSPKEKSLPDIRELLQAIVRYLYVENIALSDSASGVCVSMDAMFSVPKKFVINREAVAALRGFATLSGS